MDYIKEQCFAGPTLTKELMEMLVDTVSGFKITAPVFFEATCGDGRLVEEIKSMYPRAAVYANDIDPIMAAKTKESHKNTYNKDFLATRWKRLFERHGHTPKQTVVCTGFPYGKDSKLAIECFNAAAKFADTMVIIVPASFNKPTYINQLNRRFHLKSIKHVKQVAFEMPNGKTKTVGSVIQVWRKQEQKRELISVKNKHGDFHFVTPKEKRTGHKLDVTIKSRGRDIEYVYEGEDGRNIKTTDHLRFQDPHGRALDTIRNFKYWEPLMKNSIQIGMVTQTGFVLAHENHHEGLHQDFFDMIS